MKMKKILTTAITILLVSISATYAQNNLGINTTTPSASAALHVDTAATGPQGILIPRMTQARRDAITTPATGLLIYQTDNTAGFYNYNGTAWAAVGSASSSTATLQLVASKNTAQTLTVAPGITGITPTGDVVVFQNTTGTLTNGNTWANNTFTAGATGTGLYLVTVQITIDIVNAYPMIEINGGGFTNQNNYFGTSVGTSSSNLGGNCPNNTCRNFRGVLSVVVPMVAGDYFQVKAQNVSTVVGGTLSGDKGCKLTIVKLN